VVAPIDPVEMDDTRAGQRLLQIWNRIMAIQPQVTDIDTAAGPRPFDNRLDKINRVAFKVFHCQQRRVPYPTGKDL
jgi:hypothetical protein